MANGAKKLMKQLEQYEYKLIVMRHAKTEALHIKGDFHRELTDKGVKQSKRMGKLLLELDLMPDKIACSGAVRARQTLERMLKIFGDHPSVNYDASLYEEGLSAMWDVLGNTKHKVKTLMIVAHEPTVTTFSHWVSSTDVDSEKIALLNVGMPTAGAVILASHDPFASWEPHSADLLAIIAHKEITA